MPVRRIAYLIAGALGFAVVLGLQASPYVVTAWHALSDELPTEISGPADVLDGDTLDVDGHRIRLWGIDAPETDQPCYEPDGASWPCGEEATTALKALINERPVACEPLYRDPYDRVVARCARNDADLGAWLVEHGWALDWPRYSDGHYEEAQNVARAARSGMWRGTFELPWEWRRE